MERALFRTIVTPENAMWFFLQGLIITVVASKIHWQWTPNPYLASGAGLLLAWVPTQVIVEFRKHH
jgi:hypothetical protein